MERVPQARTVLTMLREPLHEISPHAARGVNTLGWQLLGQIVELGTTVTKLRDFIEDATEDQLRTLVSKFYNDVRDVLDAVHGRPVTGGRE